jgi:hypothetical protein
MSNHVFIKDNLHNYGRVEPGWAARYASDRFFNPNAMVCPPRKYLDLLGRPSDHYSLITTTPGCSSALDRVKVEDYQRPSDFNSVSLSGLGVNGGSWEYDSVKRMNQDIAQQYQAVSGTIVDPRAYYSLRNRENQWLELGNKVRYYKCKSGCL